VQGPEADESELDRIFAECYPGLVRYCQRLTGDPDMAEDIAQEAIVRLFDRGGPSARGGVRGWLFTTATHLARDGARQRSNRRKLLARNPPTRGEPERPDHVFERAEARARARAALDSLRPRDREVLLLRYSGLSYREIARVVGVVHTSVGTLLARAERRFAEAAGQWEAE